MRMEGKMYSHGMNIGIRRITLSQLDRCFYFFNNPQGEKKSKGTCYAQRPESDVSISIV
jgi:hypothetical protein